MIIGSKISTSTLSTMRQFLDIGPDAMVVVDRDAKIVLANEMTVSLLGWPIDDLEGKSLNELIPERFRADHARHVTRFLESPEARPMGAGLDLWARSRDGSEIPVQISLSSWIDESEEYVVASIRDVSHQHRSEMELTASKDLFRTAAQLTADVIQLVDIEQDLIQPYSDVDSLMGFQPGEFPRSLSKWFELIHPEDRDRIEKEVAGLIEAGSKGWRFKYRIRDAEGSFHHWIDQGIVTEYSEDGSIRKGIGVTQDATERVRAQEAVDRTMDELRKSEQRFRIVADHTADIVQTANVEKDQILHHHDVDTLMGYPEGGFPSTISGWMGLIHPDDRDRIEQELGQVIADGGDKWDLEYRILAGDGSYHHWHDRGTVTGYLEDGSANTGVGAIQDITERVRSREKLKRQASDLSRSAELLRAIIDSGPDCLVVLDRAGRIAAVNKEWTRFAEENGATDPTKTGVGLNYVEVCSSAADEDPDSGSILAGIQSVLDGSRSSFKIDYPCNSPSEERWFMLTVTPLLGSEGGVVISHRNITERIQRTVQLEKALAEVESLRDRLSAESDYLQEEIRGSLDSGGQIVGQSDPWMRVLEQVNLVARTDSTVLLLGETGTGKELIARAVQAASARVDHPLIKVNCGSLPSTLIESELFGHEKGAFTGADATRSGRFELADGGTIFLDEIGELPMELQTKLLHVLQDGEFERLGSSKPHKVDVRVIAATNRDLEVAVAEGRFRSDLYYRLAVFPIQLPPLRDRRDDIPLLATYFLGRHGAVQGKSITTIPESTMDALQAYDWPGNVRELQNVIERGVIVSQGDVLEIGEIVPRSPRDRRSTDDRGSVSLPRQTGAPTRPIGPAETLKDLERSHITTVLEACNWTVKGRGNAADRLGLKESTLRSRMKRLGIRRPGNDRGPTNA